MRRWDPLLVVLLVIAVVFPPVFGLFPGGWTPLIVPFWGTLTFLMGSYAVSAFRTARLYRGTGKPVRAARRTWQLSAIAGAIWFAGTASMLPTATGTADRESVMGSPLQALAVLAGMAVLLFALLRFPTEGESREGRFRLRLDVATVMAGAATGGLLLIQPPPGEHDTGWLLNLAVAVAIQPGLFLVALFAMVKLFLGRYAPFSRAAGILTALAAAVQTGAQTVPASGYLDRREGAWMMGLNILGSALLAVGTRLQVRSAFRSPDQLSRRSGNPYTWLPYAAMVVTWAISAGVLAGDGLTWRSWVVGAGAMVTTTLVVARQVFAFRHIAELLRERDELTAKLTRQAYHDALTGLANRALFMGSLTAALDRGPVTVFLIDLDEFKPVNDTLGHAAGDQLLIHVGKRLRGCVRAGDVVARLGGDEFAVLAEDADPARLAQALHAALNGTATIGATQVPLRASIGLATSVPGVHDADGILHQADMAMYANKNSGRSLRTQ